MVHGYKIFGMEDQFLVGYKVSRSPLIWSIMLGQNVYLTSGDMVHLHVHVTNMVCKLSKILPVSEKILTFRTHEPDPAKV